MREKPKLYAELGIREYFLFDPTEDYLDPPLQGYRLINGEHVAIERAADGSLVSQELELRLMQDEDQLAFFRLDNGARLLTSEEGRIAALGKLASSEGRLAATQVKLESAEEVISQYESELARLREEVARLQSKR